MFGTLNLLHAMREVSRTSHLIKIGTMGEYGTPNLPIPEGEVEIEIDGHRDLLPFPRSAWSWYHQTKVHDTHNIRMACKLWGIRCTDVMQGIVYGSKVDGMYGKQAMNTRLDFDQYFGTAINRFVVQAVIGHPLTIYGRGTQVRSILPLQDSINCLNLIALNPPAPGVYRELNQFHEYMGVASMADIVVGAHYELTGVKPDINHYENPRREKEEHFYQPMRSILERMGYRPSQNINKVVRCMIIEVLKYKGELEKFSQAIVPTTHWSGDTHAAQTLSN
jgi:nucleoside-diphosphate-sugar epimerase